MSDFIECRFCVDIENAAHKLVLNEVIKLLEGLGVKIEREAFNANSPTLYQQYTQLQLNYAELQNKLLEVQGIPSDPNDMAIEDIDFTGRTFNCLKNDGIKFLSQLKAKRDHELLSIPQLGKKSLTDIRLILRNLEITGIKLNEKEKRN